MKAVDTSTPEVYSRNDPKSPISQATLDLIKEKRRLWRLYRNTEDPNTEDPNTQDPNTQDPNRILTPNPPRTSCRKKLGPK